MLFYRKMKHSGEISFTNYSAEKNWKENFYNWYFASKWGVVAEQELWCRQKLIRIGNLTFNGGINYTIVFYRGFFRGNVRVAIILLPNEIILQQEKLW